MSRRYTTLFAGAAFALFGALGAAAYAQSPAPAPAAGSHHEVQVIKSADGSEVRIERDGGRTMIMRTERRHEDMADHLRAVLQLKPAQEAALTAYVQALEPKTGTMVMMEKHEAPKTTPERLAEMEKMMAEHEAMTRAHIDATRKFYDQLDASQKKAFDELDLGMDHMGGVHMIRISAPMPPMPPMHMMHPPMPIPPVPPAPPVPPPPPGE